MANQLPVELKAKYEKVQVLYKKFAAIAEQAKDSDDAELRKIEAITREKLLSLAEEVKAALKDLKASPHTSYSVSNYLASLGLKGKILSDRAVALEKKNGLEIVNFVLAEVSGAKPYPEYFVFSCLESPDSVAGYWRFKAFKSATEAQKFFEEIDEGRYFGSALPKQLKAESGLDNEVTYWKGDKGEYTGEVKMMHGGKFFGIKMLEGTKKGQTVWTQKAPKNPKETVTAKGMDPQRVMNCDGVQVSEKEGKRLAELGVEIPPPNKSGPIYFEGKKVGNASYFNGIMFTDKDFILDMVKEVSWYVN